MFVMILDYFECKFCSIPIKLYLSKDVTASVIYIFLLFVDGSLLRVSGSLRLVSVEPN